MIATDWQRAAELISVVDQFSSQTLCRFTGIEYRIPESAQRRFDIETMARALLLQDSAPYLEPNQLLNLGRLLRKKEFYQR